MPRSSDHESRGTHHDAGDDTTGGNANERIERLMVGSLDDMKVHEVKIDSVSHDTGEAAAALSVIGFHYVGAQSGLDNRVLRSCLASTIFPYAFT